MQGGAEEAFILLEMQTGQTVAGVLAAEGGGADGEFGLVAAEPGAGEGERHCGMNKSC